MIDDPDAACAGAALLAGSAGLGLPAPVLAATPVVPDESERHRYDRFYRDSFLPVVTGSGFQPDDLWESP